MSVYFIDLCFINIGLIHEICIMESSYPLMPYCFISNGTPLCTDYVFHDIDMSKIFYTSKDKYGIIKSLYPELCLIIYNGAGHYVPNNITCHFNNTLHVNVENICSYKKCMSLCIDYLCFL